MLNNTLFVKKIGNLATRDRDTIQRLLEQWFRF